MDEKPVKLVGKIGKSAIDQKFILLDKKFTPA
jgi:hypothetical protein